MEYRLRYQGPWRGLSYESRFEQGQGLFRRLRNFIVSSDGTELERVPGTVLCAEPGKAERQGVNVTAGTPTILDKTTPILHENGDSAVFVTDIAGNSLAQGWHPADFGSAPTPENKLEIAKASTTNGTALAYISRGLGLDIHALGEVLGLAALLFDEQRWVDASYANPPVFTYGLGRLQHIAAQTAKRKLSIANPLTPADFDYWPSWVMAQILVDLAWYRDSTNAYETNSQRYYPRPPLRKCQLESYDKTLAIAAPAIGCMFQLPAGIEGLSADSSPLAAHDGKLDTLGVPKAIYIDGSLAFVADVANGELAPSIDIFIRVAYYNSHTGEYGLVSELIEGTVPGGSAHYATFEVLHARHVLAETGADYIAVWMSDKAISGNAAALFPETRVPLGAAKTLVRVGHSAETATFPDVTNVKATLTPTRLSQMPMGSLWVRTLRGHLWSGGRIDLDHIRQHERITIASEDYGSEIEPHEGMQASVAGIPPAYEGRLLIDGYPGNGLTGQRLLRVAHAATAAPHYQRWEYNGVAGGFIIVTAGGSLQLPKGQIQFSPKENPGDSPAVQTVIVDRHLGRTVIAAGRSGSHLIFCTENETYAVSWGRNPIGADAQLISSTFGCIAPDSMVETDVGLFWLSHRGVMYARGGQVQWIGAPVESRFQRDLLEPDGSVKDGRWKKTLEGYLWGARGYWDSRRRLVTWVLRSDRVEARHDSAGLSLTISGVVAGSPTALTVSGLHHIPAGQMAYVVIEGDTERPAMNGTWIATATGPDTLTIVFDSTALSAVASGTARLWVDAYQSKLGGDEMLHLQVDGMAMSTQVWPNDPQWGGGRELPYDDGIVRPTLASNEAAVKGPDLDVEVEGDLFAVDDQAFDRMAEPLVTNVSQGPISSGGRTWIESAGTSFPNLLRHRLGTPHPCRYQAFIRSASPDARGNYALRWWGDVDAIDDSAVDRLRIVDNPDVPSPSWQANDVLEVGVIHCELETNHISPEQVRERGLQDWKTVSAIALLHEFRREVNSQQTPLVAWARAEVYANGKWIAFGTDIAHPLNVDADVSRIPQGIQTGRSLALRLVVISNARVSLKDIRMDLR